MNHESNRARSLRLWPPDKVETLRFLVEAGMHSFKAIGELMAISKNTAIGKAHRLNLDGPRMIGPKVNGPVSTLSTRLNALDVFPRFGQCVFPIGDPGAGGFHICGAAVPDDDVLSPYCANHQRVCWRPASKQTDNAMRPVELERGRGLL